MVHFAAYRLKYSRWIHVVLVPNERVEALVRSLLASFEAAEGVPLRVVFDNPKTVVVRHEEGRPVWNATLAQVAIDYSFAVELCTPRQPQQKGAVENLVGFVKRAFFRARRFVNVTTDLPQQLAAWLLEVNTVRPGTVVRAHAASARDRKTRGENIRRMPGPSSSWRSTFLGRCHRPEHLLCRPWCSREQSRRST